MYDVVVVGGGILGTTIAYWLSTKFDGKIAVIEKESQVAFHTSSRNTGVIHRPFYINPDNQKSAMTTSLSYMLWKKFAFERGLPWNEVGTVEVATDPSQESTLRMYEKWGIKNGMDSSELEVLDESQVSKIEPNVKSSGAIYSKTDVSVDFGIFTQELKKESESQGVDFLLSTKVKDIDSKDIVSITLNDGKVIESKFLINAGGGWSIDILHSMGLGLEYTDLHFRGEYWVVDEKSRNLANRNIYTVPNNPEFPFLDPHWIVRSDGRREIGPNAVLTDSPTTYDGLFNSVGSLAKKFLETPIRNKLLLLANPVFLKLTWGEWRSSFFKGSMTSRVQKFIPDIRKENLIEKGTSGIRSSVIDQRGRFVREAVEIESPNVFHITNYNSPGATGSPAFSAMIVDKLSKRGYLDHINSVKKSSVWDYDSLIEGL